MAARRILSHRLHARLDVVLEDVVVERPQELRQDLQGFVEDGGQLLVEDVEILALSFEQLLPVLVRRDILSLRIPRIQPRPEGVEVALLAERNLDGSSPGSGLSSPLQKRHWENH